MHYILDECCCPFLTAIYPDSSVTHDISRIWQRLAVFQHAACVFPPHVVHLACLCIKYCRMHSSSRMQEFTKYPLSRTANRRGTAPAIGTATRTRTKRAKGFLPKKKTVRFENRIWEGCRYSKHSLPKGGAGFIQVEGLW